ncbi:hypothetical protein C8J56DRAFT_342339 [Mycena floridula]|nr:hypothetical protein C8J56DRAFT_342339 [Mycena floridula]
MLILPEELLLVIVAYLYVPDLPDFYHHLFPDAPPSRQRSAGLCSLSLVNQQCRRICMPFLFSYVKCNKIEDLIRLRDECLVKAPFIRNIRTLECNRNRVSEAPCAALVELLPSLSSLFCLDIGRLQIDAALFSAVNLHPNLSGVLVDTVEHLVSFSPLSKFLNKSFSVGLKPLHRRSEFDQCLRLGIGIGQLELLGNCTNDPTHGQVLMGLRDVSISLWEGRNADQSLWLEEFVARHPDLQTIRFCDLYGKAENYPCLRNPHTPFVFRFIDDLQQHRMDTDTLTQFLITRPYTNKSVLNQWIVSGISLTANKSTIKIIELAHLSFPNLTSLTLHGKEEIKFDAHELTAVVSGFRAMRALNLDYLFLNLDFDTALPSQNHPDEAHHIESAIKCYAERLARACSSIEAIFVSEAKKDWSLEGQYTVTRKLLADGGGVHLASSLTIQYHRYD